MIKTIILLLLLPGCIKMKDDKPKPISITFPRDSSREFSLSPIASDTMLNYFLLENLNKTILKHKAEQGYELNAAESIETSRDGYTLIIKIRRGLVDSAGEELTPSYWIRGMRQVVGEIKAPEKMIALSNLEGWSDYLKGARPFPVKADDEMRTLTFEFATKQEKVLDYFEMPILGFWKFDNGITIPTNDVTILGFDRRKISFRNNKDKRTWIIRIVDENQNIDTEPNEIILPASPRIIKNSKLIKSSPTAIDYAQFSAGATSIFKDINDRRFFAKRILDYVKNNLDFRDDMTPTSSIFYDVQDGVNYQATEYVPRKRKEIRVLMNNYDPKSNKNDLSSLVTSVFSEYFEKIKFITNDSSKRSWEIITSQDYDFRIGGVYNGTSPDYRVIDQMFCTTQSTCLADHNNSVCKLIKESPNLEKYDLGLRLNQVVSREAGVIPLYSTSFLFYLGSNISSSSISSSSALPDLSRIKLENENL